MCFSAINGSGPVYLSELLHVYTPSRTLRSSSDTPCWKSNNTNARLMAFAPSLTLDPTFGIHSHKTLDTAQPFRLWQVMGNGLQTQNRCFTVYLLWRQHVATRRSSRTCGRNTLMDPGQRNTKSRWLPPAALASYLYLLDGPHGQQNLCRLPEVLQTTSLCFF